MLRPLAPLAAAVAPPERSYVYSFGTVNGATAYEPDELIPMDLDVLQRVIMGKRSAGTVLVRKRRDGRGPTRRRARWDCRWSSL